MMLSSEQPQLNSLSSEQPTILGLSAICPLSEQHFN